MSGSRWAQLLTFEADNVAEAGPEHRVALGELRRVLEQGLPLAHYSYESAPLEAQLARCLVLQARAADDEKEKRDFFKQALRTEAVHDANRAVREKRYEVSLRAVRLGCLCARD